MVIEQDVDQMSLHECVLLDALSLVAVLIVIHYPSPGPSASQSTGKGCVNVSFHVVTFVNKYPGTALVSPNRTVTEDNPLDSASR